MIKIHFYFLFYVCFDVLFTGNAAFGSQLLDKTKFTHTSYVIGQHKSRLAVNDPLFRDMKPIETVGDMYEISRAYRKVSLNLPLYIGLNILLNSKKKILEWHYSFLCVYLEKEHFSHVLMDTDALYTQFAFKTLEESVKPAKKAEFLQLLKNSCGPDKCAQGYLPRTCCDQCNRWDQKVPLLMKEEYHSRLMIALTAKTYVCAHTSDGTIKLSCKGVQKNIVKANDPVAMYRRVLESGNTEGSINRGFRALKGRMYTYEIKKDAFPFFYIKREVLACAKFTKTLSVVLQPCPVNYFCLVTEAPELSLDYTRLPFIWQGYHLKTLRQAVTLTKYAYCTSRAENPIPHPLNTFALILKTTEARQFARIQQELGPCEIYNQHQLVNLIKIVQSRMNTHPQLYNSLAKSDNQLIVNACALDSELGTGANARECKFRKGAHLGGHNFLGKVYMVLRKRLHRVVPPPLE